jgi:hypothetical protein
MFLMDYQEDPRNQGRTTWLIWRDQVPAHHKGKGHSLPLPYADVEGGDAEG